jgi:hypothetical protein
MYEIIYEILLKKVGDLNEQIIQLILENLQPWSAITGIDGNVGPKHSHELFAETFCRLEINIKSSEAPEQIQQKFKNSMTKCNSKKEIYFYDSMSQKTSLSHSVIFLMALKLQICFSPSWNLKFAISPVISLSIIEKFHSSVY